MEEAYKTKTPLNAGFLFDNKIALETNYFAGNSIFAGYQLKEINSFSKLVQFDSMLERTSSVINSSVVNNMTCNIHKFYLNKFSPVNERADHYIRIAWVREYVYVSKITWLFYRSIINISSHV